MRKNEAKYCLKFIFIECNLYLFIYIFEHKYLVCCCDLKLCIFSALVEIL